MPTERHIAESEIDRAAFEMLVTLEPEQFYRFVHDHNPDETLQSIANHYFREQAELAVNGDC